MTDQEFVKMPLNDLVDIRDVKIDRSLPMEERVRSYVEQVKDPYHFRVHTSNVSAGDQEAAYFESVVKSSQNVRSVLESVIIESVMEMGLYWGGYLHTAETIFI